MRLSAARSTYELSPPTLPTPIFIPAGYPWLLASIGRPPTVDDADYNSAAIGWPPQFGRLVINANDREVIEGCGEASPPSPSCTIFVAVYCSVPERSLFILTAIVTSEVLVDGQPLLSHSDYLVCVAGGGGIWLRGD